VVVLRYPNARTCVVGPGLTAPGAFTNLAVSGGQKITEITGGTGTVSFT
jgi:hypothetical protein